MTSHFDPCPLCVFKAQQHWQFVDHNLHISHIIIIICNVSAELSVKSLVSIGGSTPVSVPCCGTCTECSASESQARCTSAVRLAFVISCNRFHGRLGNPIDCLVYVKHIELDDCPFILLHSYLPQDSHDHSLEDEFYKLSSHLDVVISELASEFFYYAPMRRQRTFGTRNFGARCREMS